MKCVQCDSFLLGCAVEFLEQREREIIYFQGERKGVHALQRFQRERERERERERDVTMILFSRNTKRSLDGKHC